MRLVSCLSAAAFACALVAAAAAPQSKAAPPAAASGRPSCCYTNPQYAGVCVVQAGEGETCASIRAYLNNPRAQGKTYCASTNVRGGWKQVRCARAPRGQ
jgi:hypothetical protein